MTIQIEALTEALNANGFSAKIWKGSRIYLNGYGKDISAYITLDWPDAPATDGRLFDGCALKVFSNADQTGAWKVNRAKQVKHNIMTALYDEGNGITGYFEPPCATWQEVIL